MERWIAFGFLLILAGAAFLHGGSVFAQQLPTSAPSTADECVVKNPITITMTDGQYNMSNGKPVAITQLLTTPILPSDFFPRSIIFEQDGVQKYLLNIQKFSNEDNSFTDDEVTIHSTLCYNNNGVYTNYWPEQVAIANDDGAELDTQKSSAGKIDNIEVDLDSTESELYIRFESSVQESVTIYFYFTESANIFSITSLAFAPGKISGQTVLRAELTEETISALKKKIPSFNGKSQMEITGSITFTLQKKNSSEDPIVFTVAMNGEGALAGAIPPRSYYKWDNLTAGNYLGTFAFNINVPNGPWEDIRKDITLTEENLSSTDSARVVAGDIFPLSFGIADIKTDACMKCETILSCLACVDHTIVSRYDGG
ncbi:MAG: hypothetical protein V1776_05050 [Candidatus Diapherotrites archaeon]